MTTTTTKKRESKKFLDMTHKERKQYYTEMKVLKKPKIKYKLK